jgi:hypothetical protein
MSRLPLGVRMTFLIVTLVLAVLVRVAAIHVEGVKPEERVIHQPEQVPG